MSMLVFWLFEGLSNAMLYVFGDDCMICLVLVWLYVRLHIYNNVDVNLSTIILL